jgi:hypothetical protein
MGRLPVDAGLDELWFSLSEEKDGPGVGVGDALVPARAPLGVRSRYSESVVLALVFRRAMMNVEEMVRRRIKGGRTTVDKAEMYIHGNISYSRRITRRCHDANFSSSSGELRKTKASNRSLVFGDVN